jgi:hypothetical protein
MIPNPSLTNQLARERHRQMLAADSQRQLARVAGPGGLPNAGRPVVPGLG